MEIFILIIVLYVLAYLLQKSDLSLMKEAEKLPPFTKEEVEYYYYNELKKRDKYKVIRSGNTTVAQGYECQKCKLIRPYHLPLCKVCTK